MRIYLLILFFLVTVIFCQQPEKNVDKKPYRFDSTLNSSKHASAEFKLSSLLSIDSITDADNYFTNVDIDSIAINSLHFDAIYLTCFKAVVNYHIYQYLKEHFPSEYNSILAIHTQHSILVDGHEFSFNAKGSYGCRSIPESSKVVIDSKVFSFFSENKHLGKLVIIESIERHK